MIDRPSHLPVASLHLCVHPDEDADARALFRTLPVFRIARRNSERAGAMLLLLGLFILTMSWLPSVMPIALGVALLVSHRTQMRSLRPSLRGVDGVTNPQDLVLDAEGITATTPTSASRFRWTAFTSWVNDRDGILLLLGDGLQWRWLPRRAADPHDWQFVVDLVSANLTPYDAKRARRVNRR